MRTRGNDALVGAVAELKVCTQFVQLSDFPFVISVVPISAPAGDEQRQ